jgi:dihydroflavonol-4-reductase
MREKVAVIGGTGYLGSTLVRELIAAGYEPVVVARNPDKVDKVLPGIGVETRRADVTDLKSLSTALQGCTYVHSAFALLTQIFTAPNKELEEEAIRVTVEGTLNALRAAHEAGAKRVVITGTCSARYRKGGVVSNEDTPPTPPGIVDDPYVRSKVKAEEAAAEFAKETGLEIVTILPGALTGPWDTAPTPFNAGVVRRLRGSVGAGIEGSFPVVDVRDVARAHIAAMVLENPRDTYLLVNRTVSTSEWSELLSKATGFPGADRYMSPRVAMFMARFSEFVSRLRGTAPRFTRNTVQHVIQNQQYDCSRAKEELGITLTPLRTTVWDMVQWYVDHGWVDDEERLAIVRASLAKSA